MAFKKRRMMVIPEVNPKSFVFFFEKGNSGTSWSIRDYSIRNRVKEYGPRNFRWTADEIHQKAQHSLDAPTHHTDDLAFWHDHTNEYNRRYLPDPSSESVTATTPHAPTISPPLTPPQRSGAMFPVLNLPTLLNSRKGRKAQDMDRILLSPNSEDWVTWNFMEIMKRQYPNGWWGHLVSAARRRSPEFRFPFEDRSLPRPLLWSSVPAPSEYEAQSRIRMRNSANQEWILRANNPDPVEGSSEIDVIFDHDHFLVYVEAKLGSDVSLSTTYDPQRNQIIRNIDCLIENAGDRTPIFWMLVRDEEPSRAYVQLMKSYRADPRLLVRDLPHCKAEALEEIAKNLTILRWSDFGELVCGPGWDEESTAVKQELDKRTATSFV